MKRNFYVPEATEKNPAVRATRVLLVEDNQSDAFLVNDILKKFYPGSFDLVHTENEGDALRSLGGDAFDVCLLDLSLPDAHEFSTLQQMMNRQPQMPVLILTGNENDEAAHKAVAMGAQDYLIKQKADGQSLKQAIDYAIERKKHHEDLVRSALYDPLTNLARRETFVKSLNAALARIKRTDRAVAIFFIDLDKFKSVNDTWGHATGDKLLQAVAGRLKKALRPYDVLARFGGDEFVVLIDDAASLTNCSALAQKLINEIMAPVNIEGTVFDPGASIGVATTFNRKGIDAEALLKEADLAMYQAKAKEGNSFCIYMPQSLENKGQSNSGEMLVDAIRNNYLQLYYQPRVNASTGGLLGMEALLRLNHPEKGMILPGDFMPVANHAGLSHVIDKWVLNRLANDMQVWKEENITGFQIGLNVSPGLMKSKEQTDRFFGLIREMKIDTQMIALDVPEIAFNTCPMEQAKAVCNRFLEAGMSLHLDHFGRDTAPFMPMLQLPFTLVRLDRAMLTAAEGDSPHIMQFISIFINLAHRFNMRVGCVGLEKASQRAMVKKFGIDELQGFAIGIPMPRDEAMRWAKKNMLTYGNG
jgi:diguanylate cyclase (GGDEF)-like protein